MTRRRDPAGISMRRRPTFGQRIGSATRYARRRIGLGLQRVGTEVGKFTNRTVLPAVQKSLQSVSNAADKVGEVNRATGGLLEEAVRSVPFGDQAVYAANVAARGAKRGSQTIARVRRVGSTIERSSNAVGRRLAGQR